MSVTTTKKLLGFLQSAVLAERVAGLQFLFAHPDLLTHPEVAEALAGLAPDREPLIRFWLKKLHHLRRPDGSATTVRQPRGQAKKTALTLPFRSEIISAISPFSRI
jgi:hypothetical protein